MGSAINNSVLTGHCGTKVFFYQLPAHLVELRGDVKVGFELTVRGLTETVWNVHGFSRKLSPRGYQLLLGFEAVPNADH